MGLLGVWRKFFPKKEVHLIEGRRVIIVTKEGVDPAVANKIKVEILAISKTRNAAKLLPKVTYFIYPNAEYSGYATVSFIRKNFEISLNAENLTDSVFLRKTLNHELTHLWQEFCARMMTRFRKRSKKLLIKMFRKFKWNFRNIKTLDNRLRQGSIRFTLFQFFQMLLYEGQTQFSETFFDEKLEFTPAYFAYTHKVAQDGAQDVRQKWESYLENVQQGELIKEENSYEEFFESSMNAYWIGFHMVYTLCYFEDLDLEMQTKVGIFKFIKRYEKLIANHGLTPIVSATSGIGILDYKKMVNEWWQTVDGKILRK